MDKRQLLNINFKNKENDTIAKLIDNRIQTIRMEIKDLEIIIEKLQRKKQLKEERNEEKPMKNKMKV